MWERFQVCGIYSTNYNLCIEPNNRLNFYVQGYYIWDPALDAQMLEIWERKSAKPYNDNMSAARKKAGEKARMNEYPQYDETDPNRDMSVLKHFPSSWISSDVWVQTVDRWNSDNWKTVSGVARGNRDSQVSLHTG